MGKLPIEADVALHGWFEALKSASYEGDIEEGRYM